jgi:hypothetical protein
VRDAAKSIARRKMKRLTTENAEFAEKEKARKKAKKKSRSLTPFGMTVFETNVMTGLRQSDERCGWMERAFMRRSTGSNNRRRFWGGPQGSRRVVLLPGWDF